MAIEIKFTCNICGKIFISNDQKCKVPLGWGSVTPTLRVNMPDIDSFKNSKKKKDGEWENYRKFDRKCQTLKDSLKIRTYHICHKCLELGQDSILKIEEGKIRGRK